MSLIIKECDLLESDCKYIVHQTNCITTNAAGLAKILFEKYPHANIYKDRKSPDIPGTIKICGNGENQRYIINLMGQYYPGRDRDAPLKRKQWFFQGLRNIANIDDIQNIGFPYEIGCGLAGGNWDEYYKMITIFADYIFNKDKTQVIICKLPEKL